jgi:hypothetical protein
LASYLSERLNLDGFRIDRVSPTLMNNGKKSFQKYSSR